MFNGLDASQYEDEARERWAHADAYRKGLWFALVSRYASRTLSASGQRFRVIETNRPGTNGSRSIAPALLSQDVAPAEIVLDALRGGEGGVAVGDIGLDGDRAAAELLGQRLVAVRRRAQQGDAMPRRIEGMRGACSNS